MQIDVFFERKWVWFVEEIGFGNSKIVMRDMVRLWRLEKLILGMKKYDENMKDWLDN